MGKHRIGGVKERRQPDRGKHTVAADVVVEGLFRFPAAATYPLAGRPTLPALRIGKRPVGSCAQDHALPLPG